MIRTRPALIMVVALVVTACAGPEDPTTEADTGVLTPTSTSPSPTQEEGPATTADGRLDFGAIAGTWSGNVEWRLYGEAADPGAFEIQVDEAAEQTATVGTITELGTGGGADPVCTGTLLAVDSDPPTYVFRVRWDEDQVCSGSGRVILRHDPAGEAVTFKYQGGDASAEGEFAEVPAS